MENERDGHIFRTICTNLIVGEHIVLPRYGYHPFNLAVGAHCAPLRFHTCK